MGVVIKASDYEGKENVIIENVQDSQIVIPFSIKCLYIKHMSNTRIYVGSVSGASFVNEATDCMLHLQSHQIRIHHSHRVQFFLTARSNPIIEHCSECSFGRYIDQNTGVAALQFDGWEQQAEAAGLKVSNNLFSAVLDFNWHKQEQSPNWKSLETSTSAPVQIN